MDPLPDILKADFFTFDNFAQEKGQQNSKYANKVGKNWQKAQKIKKKTSIFQFARTNLKTWRNNSVFHCDNGIFLRRTVSLQNGVKM